MSKLKKLRLASGMTQKELAKESGVSFSAISKIEQGDRDIKGISAENLYKLASTLGCQMEDLLNIVNRNEKYYKFLPADLISHDYKFKDGLNVDPVEFNHKYAYKGGFTFYRKANLMEDVCGGAFVCDVTIPKDARVADFDYELKADKIIISNIRNVWDLDAIKELEENGVDLHVDDDKLLVEASYNGCLDIVKYLVEKGARVCAQTDSALAYASYNNHIDVARFLLENGARTDSRNDRILTGVSESGYIEIVKLLIEHGADIHARNDSALVHASKHGHLDIVKLLVENGANVNANEAEALDSAITGSHVEIVKLLLEKGAKIKTRYGSHMTLAVSYGNAEILNLLIEHGGDVSDVTGSSVLIAKEKGHEEVLRILKEYKN